MIKSKKVMLVLSITLSMALVTGGVFLNFNFKKLQENTVKAEVIEDLDLKSEDNKEEDNEDTAANKTIEREENVNEEEAVEPSNNNDSIESIVEPEVAAPQPEPVAAAPQPEPVAAAPQPEPVAAAPQPEPVAPIPQPVVVDNSNYIAEIEQAILQILNQRRAEAGLGQLSYNGNMQYYARIKSKDMGDRGYFNHINPDGVYMNQIIKADGISYRAWGENIAYIQGLTDHSALATRFMNNWMNSSGHRENILSSNFTSVGIGVYKAGDTYYATQEFFN